MVLQNSQVILGGCLKDSSNVLKPVKVIVGIAESPYGCNIRNIL